MNSFGQEVDILTHYYLSKHICGLFIIDTIKQQGSQTTSTLYYMTYILRYFH